MALYMKRVEYGKMVAAEGGISDPNLAEVRLSPDEYFYLWSRIYQAEQKISELRATTEDKITEIELENNKLRETLDAQKELNANLKRIARERANAKRGLIPKKAHPGYIVLFSSQFREH